MSDRPPARRPVRAARIAVGLLAVASFDVGANGQEAPPTALVGFQGSAAASGVHVFYNPEGLVPIPPPIDAGAPDALATISSGPATYARAAVLDPGDLLANPDALLSLFSTEYPSGTLPPWPFRISASSGIGEPKADSNPAPGLTGSVEVSARGSTARASTATSDVPAVVSVGATSASATTDTDGSRVTVRAVSRVGGVNILGLISIESVLTEITATSEGAATELSGGTRISGANVLGVPVTIDERGVHPTGGGDALLRPVLGPVVEGLNGILAQAGIRVTASGPRELAGANAGQLASTGLRIDFELSPNTFPALAQLIGSLPPLENPVPGAPSVEDLLAVAQARHLASIDLGRGSVSLTATAGSDDAIASPGVADGGSFGSPPFIDASGGGTVEVPPLDRTAAPNTPAGATLPDAPAGAGVSALVLMALLLGPFLGERVAAICTTLLGTSAADSCGREGQ